MRLLEFQAKRILAANGITVPRSSLMTRNDRAPSIPAPVALKAQVTVGGRGKAGGIKIARRDDDIGPMLDELFAMNLKGQPVDAVLSEELVEITKEFYLAVLIDKRRCLPVVVASGEGGVDIEEVARTSPEKIVKKHFDLEIGLQFFEVRDIAQEIGLEDWKGLARLLERMLAILQNLDATLVEINPLALTPTGLKALDAKIILDDKAAFRHPEFYDNLKAEQNLVAVTQKTKTERIAAEYGITYVPLGGSVGLISDGAGTGMLTIDLITDFGGKPADFCELGGLGDAGRMCQAIEVILSDPCVKVLLITLIGGLTRMDDMANGIAAFLRGKSSPVPFVVRMCGTREEAGKEILREFGINTYDDLSQAVRKAVELAEVS